MSTPSQPEGSDRSDARPQEDAAGGPDRLLAPGVPSTAASSRSGALTLRPVTDEEYRSAAASVALPIEQAPAWSAFDAVVPGRSHWGRLVLRRGDEVLAALSLAEVALPGGASFLWAKNGPVWIGDPTAAEEAELRRLLRATLPKVAPRALFVRLHVRNDADDVEPLLQGITYDRTVVVPLGRAEDEIFAGMKQQGRRAIRKALKDDTLVVAEETATAPGEFGELYDVLVETAAREGFGAHPQRRYVDMLTTLGSEHARVFVARRRDAEARDGGEDRGRVLAWALVVVNDAHALYSVGASNAEARGAYAADLLHWTIIRTLNAEGVLGYDLAGAGSERFPGLNGLTQFKTKFEKTIVEVAPAVDVPVRRWAYRVLVLAREGRQRARQVVSGVRSRLRR